MTTVQDFQLIVKALRTIWPDLMADDYTKTLWYNLLRDIDYPTLNKSVCIYMQTNRFKPTPADIRMIASDILNGPQEGAAQAWETVTRALSRANMNEEFAKLPEIVQKVVGGPGTLREWSVTDTTQLQVQRAMFMKQYEAIRNAERKQAALQTPLRYELEQKPDVPMITVKKTEQKTDGVPMPNDQKARLMRRLNGFSS